MANFVHRTTKNLLKSQSPNSLPEPIANYIENPDLSAVQGFASKYWLIVGDIITLMDQAARDVVDTLEAEASRDSAVTELDQLEGIVRAFMLVVIDEFNRHSLQTNAILDAIDNASNLATLKADIALINDLPQRTAQQLRTAVRNKLGS